MASSGEAYIAPMPIAMIAKFSTATRNSWGGGAEFADASDHDGHVSPPAPNKSKTPALLGRGVMLCHDISGKNLLAPIQWAAIRARKLFARGRANVPLLV